MSWESGFLVVLVNLLIFFFISIEFYCTTLVKFFGEFFYGRVNTVLQGSNSFYRCSATRDSYFPVPYVNQFNLFGSRFELVELEDNFEIYFVNRQ